LTIANGWLGLAVAIGMSNDALIKAVDRWLILRLTTRANRMRLWTLHPRYLDTQGLVALWREALLAQKVLQGGTKGYKHHSQLVRFRAASDPFAAIATYLVAVQQEAASRGYAFDASKIATERLSGSIDETEGQLLYEWRHLQQKLEQRDLERHKTYRAVASPAPHPLFRIVPGDVRPWEVSHQQDSR
jgi:pyrimidine dimer DNA glycosylase